MHHVHSCRDCEEEALAERCPYYEPDYEDDVDQYAPTQVDGELLEMAVAA